MGHNASSESIWHNDGLEKVVPRAFRDALLDGNPCSFSVLLLAGFLAEVHVLEESLLAAVVVHDTTAHEYHHHVCHDAIEIKGVFKGGVENKGFEPFEDSIAGDAFGLSGFFDSVRHFGWNLWFPQKK